MVVPAGVAAFTV
jgi:hypothetical protein